MNHWAVRSVAHPLQDGGLASICTSYNEDSELDLWKWQVGHCGNRVCVSHACWLWGCNSRWSDWSGLTTTKTNSPSFSGWGHAVDRQAQKFIASLFKVSNELVCIPSGHTRCQSPSNDAISSRMSYFIYSPVHDPNASYSERCRQAQTVHARFRGADCELTLFLWVYDRLGASWFISLDSISIWVLHITTFNFPFPALPDGINYAPFSSTSPLASRYHHAPAVYSRWHITRNPVLFLQRYGMSVIALFVYVLLISKPYSLSWQDAGDTKRDDDHPLYPTDVSGTPYIA